MSRRALAFTLLLLATPAVAAERSVYLAGFDKVRVQGPFEVRIVSGRAPAASVSGDAAAIEAVELRVDGATLVIRNAIGRWQEKPGARATTPVVVTLTTPLLVAASVIGGGRLTIDRMVAARVDLSVTGAGTIGVDAVDAEAANVTVIGGGGIVLAGQARQARLMTNGAGTIDAGKLDAGDLVVRLDGPGATTAKARYTASVINTGLGQVSVAGRPKCTVKADAGGPVMCGSTR